MRSDIIVIGIAALAAIVWSWRAAVFFRRFEKKAAATPEPSEKESVTPPRYVRNREDPSGAVYKVVGPGTVPGFLALEDTSGDGRPLTYVAEDFLDDVYGYDPQAQQLAKLLAAQAAMIAKARDTSDAEDVAPPPPLRGRKVSAPVVTTNTTILKYERALMKVKDVADSVEDPTAAETLSAIVEEAFSSEEEGGKPTAEGLGLPSVIVKEG